MTKPLPALKPCPFCGKQPSLIGTVEGDWYIYCRASNYDIHGSYWRLSERAAINAWNRRKP